MSDRDRQACLFQCCLRRCATGPEYGQFIVMKLSETMSAVGPLKVHADHLGLTNVDRRSMELWEPRGNLYSADRIGRTQTAHRDDQFAAKFARHSGVDVGDVHWRHAALGDVTQRDPRFHELLFE